MSVIEVRRGNPKNMLVGAGIFVLLSAGCVCIGMMCRKGSDTFMECMIMAGGFLLLMLAMLLSALQASRWLLTVDMQTGAASFHSLTKHCVFQMTEISASIELVDHKISSKYPLITEQLLIKTDEMLIRVELGFPNTDDPYRLSSPGCFQNAPELLQYLESIGKLNLTSHTRGEENERTNH